MRKSKISSSSPVLPWIYLVWAIFVASSYWMLNPKYSLAVAHQAYFAPVVSTLVILALLGWLYAKTKILDRLVSGIGIFFLSVILLLPYWISFSGSYSSIHFGANAFVQLVAHYVWMIWILLLVWLSAYGIGDRIMQWMRWSPERYGLWYSLAIGQMVWTGVLFLLGVLGLLHQMILGGILLLFIAINVKRVWSLVRSLWQPIHIKGKRSIWLIILSGILILFVGLNLVYNIKAFPIGWDAGSYYINLSSLIGEESGLVRGYQAYNQSLFGSLGLLIFKSLPGVFALVISGGILVALLIYQLVRQYASRTMALFAALWFYSLPTVSFLSTKDVKIDLGLLFILIVTVLMFVEWLGTKTEQKKSVLVVVGLLLGFAVGIKYTAVFFAGSLLVMYWYARVGLRSALALLLVMVSAFVLIRVDRISGVAMGVSGGKLLALVTAIPGILYLLIKNKKKVLAPLKLSGVLAVVALLGFGPWMGKHLAENRSIKPMKWLFGKSEFPKLNEKFLESDEMDIREALFIALRDKENKKKERSSKNEEILRYLGYERGITRFVSLPYDVMNNLNIRDPYVHVGFLFLMLLPILLWSGKIKNKWLRVLLWIIPVWLAGVGLVSHMANSLQQPELSIFELINAYFAYYNQDVTLPLVLFKVFGYLVSYLSLPILFLLKIKYVTVNFLIYPISFFLGLAGMYILHHRFKSLDERLRWLMISAYVFGVFWWIFGGGIIWYAYYMLALVIVLAAIGWDRKLKDKSLSWTRYPLWGFGGLWVMMALLLRLTGLNPETEELSKKMFVPEMFRYASGSLDKDEVLGEMFPRMDVAVKALNSSSGKVYRVGTYLPYFIRDNNKRVFSDNQLDVHDQISSRYSSKEALAATLYRDGFEYIVVDLNTATIDNTPEQSLRKKFRSFMFFLFDNPRIQQITTDRQVRGTVNGETKLFYEVFGSNETVVHSGSFAVFRIVP